MSREEVVFTKKAIVAVAVISVIASNVVIGFMAAMWLWRFSDQLEKETVEAATHAATQAAIIATQSVIEPIKIKQVEHGIRIESIQDRQDRFEEKFKRR